MWAKGRKGCNRRPQRSFSWPWGRSAARAAWCWLPDGRTGQRRTRPAQGRAWPTHSTGKFRTSPFVTTRFSKPPIPSGAPLPREATGAGPRGNGLKGSRATYRRTKPIRVSHPSSHWSGVQFDCWLAKCARAPSNSPCGGEEAISDVAYPQPSWTNSP